MEMKNARHCTMFLLLILHAGAALKCYKCDDCKEPYTPKDDHTTKCSSDACLKAVKRYEIREQHLRVIWRGCYDTETVNHLKKNNISGTNVAHYECEKDLCNSGVTYTVCTLLLIPAITPFTFN